MTVRDAVEGDVPGILTIYNDIIATSTAVYRDDPASLEDRLAARDYLVARAQEAGVDVNA